MLPLLAAKTYGVATMPIVDTVLSRVFCDALEYRFITLTVFASSANPAV